MTPERAREIAEARYEAHALAAARESGEIDAYVDEILTATAEEAAYWKEMVCANCGGPIHSDGSLRVAHCPKSTTEGALHWEVTRAQYEHERGGR